jgi:hypothetical protein
MSLRPITGSIELAAHGVRYADAIALLRRATDGVAVERLPVTVADGLLADLYRTLYGTDAECHATCIACGASFEFAVPVADKIPLETRHGVEGPDSGGEYRLAGGTRLRLPQVADALSGRRDFVIESGQDSESEIDAALEALAPVSVQDIDAPCPQCGAANRLRFDLAVFLLTAMARERPFILQEVHLLARSYGWALAEILVLTRDDRRSLVKLISADSMPPRRRRAA